MPIASHRLITLAISITLVCIIGIFVFTHFTSAETIIDGDLVSTSNSFDIYIVKLVGVKKFKRLILNPDIFNSYGHLKWENVKTVSQSTIDQYILSELVVEINPDGSIADPKVYRVRSAENNDVGERRWLNISSGEFDAAGYDWDSLYHVNHTEASPGFYPTKSSLTYQDILDEQQGTATLEDTSAQVPAKYLTSPSKWFPPTGCRGDAVEFTYSPVSVSNITDIVPMGRLSDSHVTPTDHGYINTDRSEIFELVYPVYSPADGQIIDIGAFSRKNDFRVTIWHSCTVSTIYIHLTSIAPEITAETGNLEPGANWFGSVSVTAGQQIGTMSRSVDFSVHDTTVILPGFVTPALYYGEAWKIHTVDMFDYFGDLLRNQLRGKSLRTVSPIGGKIDYDIDGRLVGNWFLEGTGGYSGGPGDYWLTHLAIAYDHVNPDLIRVSVPNSGIDDSAVCNTCFNVYAVKGNAPDPGNVTPDTGIIKYELMGRGFYSNKSLGVFLVQMLEDRRIKVEVFPSKTSSEVSGFTSVAKIYER